MLMSGKWGVMMKKQAERDNLVAIKKMVEKILKHLNTEINAIDLEEANDKREKIPHK